MCYFARLRAARCVQRLVAVSAGFITAVAVVAGPATAHTSSTDNLARTLVSRPSTAAAAPSTSNYPWAGLTYANGGDL